MSTKDEKKDERLPKQLGDFGEQLVMFLLGRLKGHKVAYVDHVGADLIETGTVIENGKERKEICAISVKTRVFSIDNPQHEFNMHQQKKIKEFAEDFDMIPKVAFVCIDKIVTEEDVNIDVYIIKLEDFKKLAIAGEVRGISVTGTKYDILHFSNAPRNQKYLQNCKYIEFHRLVLKKSSIPFDV